MMKKQLGSLSLTVSVLCFLIVLSCSGDDDSTDSDTLATIKNNVQVGTWMISKFVDSGIDETNHFTDYIFTFRSSGVLNANNGVNNYDGTWSVTNSNEDSQSNLDFNILFNLTNDFEDLNDDWDVVSRTSNKIELMDVSGGSGDTDYLTFMKN